MEGILWNGPTSFMTSSAGRDSRVTVEYISWKGDGNFPFLKKCRLIRIKSNLLNAASTSYKQISYPNVRVKFSAGYGHKPFISFTMVNISVQKKYEEEDLNSSAYIVLYPRPR